MLAAPLHNCFNVCASTDQEFGERDIASRDGDSKGRSKQIAIVNARALCNELFGFDKVSGSDCVMMSIIAQGLADQDVANVAAWYSSLKVTVTMPP